MSAHHLGLLSASQSPEGGGQQSTPLLSEEVTKKTQPSSS